jgi:hypothetical protein
MGISLCPILVGIPDFPEWYLKKIAFFLSGLLIKNTKKLVGMVIVKKVFYLIVSLEPTHNKPLQTTDSFNIMWYYVQRS